MPVYRSFLAFMAAYPPGLSEQPDRAWNRFFCFMQQQWGAEGYACWTAMTEYAKAPSKRRAIYIAETWLGSSQAVTPGTGSGTCSILDRVNLAGRGEVVDQAVAGMKSVQGWIGKLQFSKADSAKLGATPPDLFAAERILLQNQIMDDNMRSVNFNSERDIQGHAAYATTLVAGRASMTRASFYPEMWGIY